MKTVWVVTRLKYTQRGNRKVYLVDPRFEAMNGTWVTKRTLAKYFVAPEVAQEKAEQFPATPGAWHSYDAAQVEEIRVQVKP